MRSRGQSCQLDSRSYELSRLRSSARRHRQVLSQMRRPGGARAGRGLAGRSSVGRGGRRVGGVADGGRVATGSREPGAGSRGCTGGNRSPLPAPCSRYLPDVPRGARDADARYHLGVLDLTGGNYAAALAQADSIRRAVPTHLFGFMLRARALELERDSAGARRAYRDFLTNEAAERGRTRPEYSEHAQNLDAFHEQATAGAAGAAGAAPRGN